MMEQKHRIEMQRKDTELTSKFYEIKKRTGRLREPKLVAYGPVRVETTKGDSKS